LFVIVKSSAFQQVGSKGEVEVWNFSPTASGKSCFRNYCITFKEPLRCSNLCHAREGEISKQVIDRAIKSAEGMLILNDVPVLMCGQHIQPIIGALKIIVLRRHGVKLRPSG